MSVFASMAPEKAYATQSTKDKITEAEQKLNEAKKDVEKQQDEVDNLNSRQNSLKKELKGLNSELDMLAEHIEELDGKIKDKEEEIALTKAALLEAKEVEESQYKAMKKRIQYMYEDSENLYMEILFKAKSFSNFITLNNYVESLSKYDRKKFNEYKDYRIQVEELEAKLEAEKVELDGLKAEAEEEKASVVEVINKTSNKVKEYDDLIDDAEAELLEYEKTLNEQNQTLEALKKQYEEELRLSKLAAQSAWRDISEVQFDEGDRYLLAVLIYCEAGGEPYEGQVAVGAVVINRVLSSVYPSTMNAVIRQKWQFSPVASGRFDLYLAQGKTTQSCYNAADAAMSGITNVGNSLHFRTPIEGLNGIRIGNHIFY